MPVIYVRALPQKNLVRIQQALRRATAAAACGCKPKQVWATWEEIKSGFYIEGANAINLQPSTSNPPIAKILCFEGLAPALIEQTVLAAAKVLADGLGLGANVFVSYRELKSGEVVAGEGVVARTQ